MKYPLNYEKWLKSKRTQKALKIIKSDLQEVRNEQLEIPFTS